MSAPKTSGAEEIDREAGSLWHILFGPLVWAAHFALSYAATAVLCAKTGATDLTLFRLVVVLGGVAALVMLAWLAWRGWRQWVEFQEDESSRLAESAAERHAFLGRAAFLLVIVSAVGVIYTALPILMLESCR